MKEKTRFRITGAVFLTAVALICVPMLFDVKRAPISEIEPLQRQPIDAVPEIPEPPDLAPVLSARDKIEALASEDGFVNSSGTRVGQPVLVVIEDESDSASVSDPEPTEAPTAALDDAQRWAIQLGSFSSKTNANNLERRVAADEHHVWTSTAKVNDTEVFRVAVGPYLSRDEASVQRKLLSEQYTVQAIVVSYSMN